MGGAGGTQWPDPRLLRIYYTIDPSTRGQLAEAQRGRQPADHAVGNLLEGPETYRRVLAFTSVGGGPLSDPIQVKTQQGGELRT